MKIHWLFSFWQRPWIDGNGICLGFHSHQPNDFMYNKNLSLFFLALIASQQRWFGESIAQVGNGTFVAGGTLRFAKCASVIDQLMTKRCAIVGRNDFQKVKFNFGGVGVDGQPQPVGNTFCMGIDNNRRFVVDVADDNVCRLASNTR